jgi:hypothetical protein
VVFRSEGTSSKLADRDNEGLTAGSAGSGVRSCSGEFDEEASDIGLSGDWGDMESDGGEAEPREWAM